MYNAIVDASHRAAGEAGINIVIPAGTAIQNGNQALWEILFVEMVSTWN